MLSDEEKKAIVELNHFSNMTAYWKQEEYTNSEIDNYIKLVLNLIEKQSKEIEELKETLKCTQNSWYEDTQKIEEMKKQIDLDNECEIALNSKVMDLEKEIEELKEEQAKRQWVHIKENGEVEPLFYISEDKIKAKIEEVKDGTYDAKIVLQSLLEKE